MAQMQDTEGQEIPCDKFGTKYFDIGMIHFDDLETPDFAINIPMFFQDDNGSIYNSAGVLSINLNDVFEEYLNEFKDFDGGENLNKFIPFLRDYADRLEAKAKELGVL